MRVAPGTTSGYTASILDVPAIYLILVLSYVFRFESGWIPSPLGIPEFSTYSNIFWLVAFILFFVLSFSGQYSRGFRFNAENSWHLTKGIFLGFLVLTSFAFFYREVEFSRTGFVISLGFLMVFMNLYYLLRDKVIRLISPLSFERNNILIVGTGNRGVDVFETMRRNRTDLNLSLIGAPTIHLPSHINYLGPLNQFKKFLKEHRIDHVIVALEGNAIKQALDIVSTCESKGVRFSVIPDLFEVVTRQVSIGDIHGVPVVSVGSNLPIYGVQMKLKRTFDFLGASIGSILISPLLILVWLAIKIEDGGPALYSQDRVGLDGKTFRMYKFRSMKVDAEAKTGPMWAVKNDDRWTRIGAFLRRTSIDELPQLLNVINGDMSLVGPRPERPVFVNEFKQELPSYMLRHKVRGGITGWSQCNGLRGQSSIEDRTAYDLHYVENWSFFFDIRILFQTFFKLVFLQSGY
jgi:exopolysaccharide biosynthesis polyprenyl glycosylphosphotransferase